MYREAGVCQLGASSFFAAAHAHEVCGINGLPLTPNSIRVIGEFQWLKSLQHPNLCRYVDIVRGKQDRLLPVQEYYDDSVDSLIVAGRSVDCRRLACHLLRALCYLHQRRLVVRNITTASVLSSSDGVFKLCQYGLYHMTCAGTLVSFPIGRVEFLAPEVVACDMVEPSARRSSSAGDVWSAGVVVALAALGVCGGHQRSPAGVATGSVPAAATTRLRQTVGRVLGYRHSSDVLTELADHYQCTDRLQEMDADLCDLIRQCLTVDPWRRPSASHLLAHGALANLAVTSLAIDDSLGPWCGRQDSQFPLSLASSDLTLDHVSIGTDRECSALGRLQCLSLDQIYYLWKLTGGDVEGQLAAQGLIKLRPPILTMPKVVCLDGRCLGADAEMSLLHSDRMVPLSLQALCRRLDCVAVSAFFPLLESDREKPLLHSQSERALGDTAQLPLVIREADIEYQLCRTTLFNRLLQGYPFTAGRLVVESAIDIPPLYRAHVWAALLNISGSPHTVYSAIDKLVPTAADRQIDVDIPRCHQYSDLLSSPAGHAKLRRVTRAWVATHCRYVYWQGLDSLAAPFVYLNFNDEALAYVCFSAFIDKYLPNFFLQDNSAVIQEYLAVFSQLIGFHDPQLACRLRAIGFLPDLYAIPWFLTMFTHMFPLHKIVHVWDTLLLHDNCFPLCIGLGVLLRLRNRIVQYGFNDCIIVFSDLPDINVEEVIQDALRLYALTPSSVLYRQHSKPHSQSHSQPLTQPALPSVPPADSAASSAAAISCRCVPVAQLKSQCCPLVDIDDWVALARADATTGTSRTNVSADRRQPSALLTLDVRPLQLYRSGHATGSVHFSPDDDPADVDFTQWTDAVKVIVDTEHGPRADEMGARLMEIGLLHVCVLYGGHSALLGAGYINSTSSSSGGGNSNNNGNAGVTVY